jgi:hypothetical protein
MADFDDLEDLAYLLAKADSAELADNAVFADVLSGFLSEEWGERQESVSAEKVGALAELGSEIWTGWAKTSEDNSAYADGVWFAEPDGEIEPTFDRAQLGDDKRNTAGRSVKSDLIGQSVLGSDLGLADLVDLDADSGIDFGKDFDVGRSDDVNFALDFGNAAVSSSKQGAVFGNVAGNWQVVDSDVEVRSFATNNVSGESWFDDSLIGSYLSENAVGSVGDDEIDGGKNSTSENSLNGAGLSDRGFVAAKRGEAESGFLWHDFAADGGSVSENGKDKAVRKMEPATTVNAGVIHEYAANMQNGVERQVSNDVSVKSSRIEDFVDLDELTELVVERIQEGLQIALNSQSFVG